MAAVIWESFRDLFVQFATLFTAASLISAETRQTFKGPSVGHYKIVYLSNVFIHPIEEQIL